MVIEEQNMKNINKGKTHRRTHMHHLPPFQRPHQTVHQSDWLKATRDIKKEHSDKCHFYIQPEVIQIDSNSRKT